MLRDRDRIFEHDPTCRPRARRAVKRKDCKHCRQAHDLEMLSRPDEDWSAYEDAECEDHPCNGQHSPYGFHHPSRPKQSDRSGGGTTTVVFRCSWCGLSGSAVWEEREIEWFGP